jgi:rhamnosyltransferase
MIVAVYVTYNPDAEILTNSLLSIHGQVDKIIIVDNSTESECLNRLALSLKLDNLDLTCLNNNIGIAGAQNIGITNAINSGASYVMLSDQDTIYPDNYTSDMVRLFSKDNSIGAVIPKFLDSIADVTNPFVIDNKWGFKKVQYDKGVHPVMQGIASGKIISTEALKRVGMMNADLFIDWVDIEWCWRLRSKGYKVLGNADISIKHSLGDKSEFLLGKQINIRSPFRHYYITRNAFYLALHCPNITKIQRIVLFFKSFRYVIAFPIVSKPHMKHLKAVLLGLAHGLTSKLGKVDI